VYKRQPLGILAAVGLQAVARRFKPVQARRMKALLMTACCLSSAIVLAIALRFASGAFPEAYINNDAWQAMQWLSAHHQPEDRALSSPQAGQLLPAWAGVTVYVGHYSETLGYFKKIATVRTVLQPNASASEVEAFCRANGISLLYWGPDEAATGYHPTGQPFLQPIYVRGTVAIYRVDLP